MSGKMRIDGFPTVINFALDLGNVTCDDLTVTGIIKNSDGSVSAPTYSFSSDPDTGFYWSSSGVLAFTSNGDFVMSLGQNIFYVNNIVPLAANTTLLINTNSYSTADRFGLTLCTGTHSQTSGTNGAVTITPIYNQASGTAANTDLLINRTETAVGSGAQNLLDLQVATASKFKVSNNGAVTITAGTLASAISAQYVSATFTDAVGNDIAANYQITTAGTSATSMSGMNVNMLAGYTGTGYSYGGNFSTNVAATSADWISAAANIGVLQQSIATTIGDNVGNWSRAYGGNINIGVAAQAITAKNGATNIGVIGLGKNTGTTPIQLGGYFGLNATEPTFASAALMADNSDQTSDIFVARDNGTAVKKIVDGGSSERYDGVTKREVSEVVVASSVVSTATIGALTSVALADNTSYLLKANILAQTADNAERAAFEYLVAAYRQSAGGATLLTSVNKTLSAVSTNLFSASFIASGNNVDLICSSLVGSNVTWVGTLGYVIL